jgi:hypothetical protein
MTSCSTPRCSKPCPVTPNLRQIRVIQHVNATVRDLITTSKREDAGPQGTVDRLTAIIALTLVNITEEGTEKALLEQMVPKILSHVLRARAHHAGGGAA